MNNIKIGKISNEVKITNRTASLNEYLKRVSEIKKFKTADDEYDCAVKALNGDEKSRADLITRNLRFVISVAKQYEGPNTSLEELINEGNIGLVEAADKFDPKRGFKFISYAVWHVRRAINDYLKTKNKLVRLPINRSIELSIVNNEISRLEQVLGRDVDINDIDCDTLSESRDFDFDRVNLLLEIKNSSVKSLDTPIGDKDNNNYYDVIENKSILSADYLADIDNNKKSIHNLFKILNEKQQRVMTLLFGLEDGDNKNLIEVSELVGMSREGVRQIRDKSLKKLRDYGLKIGYNLEMFDIM